MNTSAISTSTTSDSASLSNAEESNEDYGFDHHAYQAFITNASGFNSTGSTVSTNVQRYKTAPLFAAQVYRSIAREYGITRATTDIYPQYGLIGSLKADQTIANGGGLVCSNSSEPWSAFICGSQGSGKSYTLNCMLENCLLPDKRIGRVQQPLAGLAFHFDPEAAGGVAETAYLCSLGVPVNVLVS